MATQGTPADRRNQLVWDEIDRGTYKQALQLCNRRIKKGERSDYLLALKALSLTLMETPATEVEAIELAQSLSTKTPPTDSVEVLRLLTRVWSMLGPQYAENATKLWERVVKTQPNNEALGKEWFQGAVRAMEWRGMQKATMNLQKTFPKRREYWFWAVVANLLLHNSLPKDSNERKLFGPLAYRMIDKARTETPEDTTVVPPRAIHTSQEVNLLLEMLPYVVSGDSTDEALKVLNSPNLGVDSKIGAGDWWGLARLRLDLYEKKADWTALYDSCATLLAGVEQQDGEDERTGAQGRGDDWRIWDGFVKAAGKLNEAGETEKAKDALQIILRHRVNASSRNPDLALVKFASLFREKSGPEGTPALLQAVEEYFGKIGTKSCCFEDLQDYLEMLKEGERKEFLQYVEKAVGEMSEEDEKSKIDKFACKINHQKFVYLLTISSVSEASSENTSAITAFVTKSLDIYTSALDLASSRSLLTTDNQYGDDAALLAVMGLVRLYLLTPKDQAPLYQATILLETLLTKSRHNYQALLFLLRLYLLLGAIPLAVDVYPRLNIKQIQNDTLSHYLLTRIDTLLPNNDRVRLLLVQAGSIYDSSRNQTPNMLQVAFDRGGYGQILGFLEFSQRVAGSVCRSMWDIELARTDRLHNNIWDAEDLEEIGHEGKVWDNRDFAVVMSCEAKVNEKSFESLFRLGPTPGESWVRAFAAAENVLRHLEASSTKQGNGTATASNGAVTTTGVEFEPEAVKNELSGLLEAENTDFTDAERGYLVFIHDIVALLPITGKDPVPLEGFVKTHFSSTPELLQKQPYDWQTLHELWTQRHIILATEILINYLKKLKTKPALPKGIVSGIEEGVKKRNQAVVDAAERVRKEQTGNEDVVQGIVDRVLDAREGGVGKILGERENVFGGVEKVAMAVQRVARAFGDAVEGRKEGFVANLS